MLRNATLGLAMLGLLLATLPGATGGGAGEVHYVEVGDIYFDPV